VLHVSSFVLGN